jgi:hypothetical protein
VAVVGAAVDALLAPPTSPALAPPTPLFGAVCAAAAASAAASPGVAASARFGKVVLALARAGGGGGGSGGGDCPAAIASLREAAGWCTGGAAFMGRAAGRELGAV